MRCQVITLSTFPFEKTQIKVSIKELNSEINSNVHIIWTFSIVFLNIELILETDSIYYVIHTRTRVQNKTLFKIIDKEKEIYFVPTIVMIKWARLQKNCILMNSSISKLETRIIVLFTMYIMLQTF